MILEFGTLLVRLPPPATFGASRVELVADGCPLMRGLLCMGWGERKTWGGRRRRARSRFMVARF